MTTADLKLGCLMSRRMCMIDGSPGQCLMKVQTLTEMSLQTAGSLCCEELSCQEMNRGGCCYRERSGCVCFDGLCCVGVDCLGARMRKASASVWSCQAPSLWRQAPAAPTDNKGRDMINLERLNLRSCVVFLTLQRIILC